MNSIFGFVVGLLQAALSLIGFVQQHPELPQAQKNQAQVVAQQAISQATKALTNGPTVSSQSLGFSANPAAGSAPLTVQFTVPEKFTNNPCARDHATNGCIQGLPTFMIDYGDNSDSMRGAGLRNTPPTEHVYATAGMYTAKLFDTTDGKGTGGPYPTIGAATISVASGSQSDISVPGMQKYTDADFGFSFWYPSGWIVQAVAGRFNVFSDTEGTTIQRLDLVDSSGKTVQSLYEFQSYGTSITVPYYGMGDGYLLNTFYFDASNHVWMAKPLPGSIGSLAPKLADVSHNTMGGLHIFSASSGHGCYYTVIPLSARKFVASTDCIPSDIGPLNYHSTQGFPLNTIVATDPSVATPVSTAEQIKTIQAEKDAYGQ